MAPDSSHGSFCFFFSNFAEVVLKSDDYDNSLSEFQLVTSASQPTRINSQLAQCFTETWSVGDYMAFSLWASINSLRVREWTPDENLVVGTFELWGNDEIISTSFASGHPLSPAKPCTSHWASYKLRDNFRLDPNFRISSCGLFARGLERMITSDIIKNNLPSKVLTRASRSRARI